MLIFKTHPIFNDHGMPTIYNLQVYDDRDIKIVSLDIKREVEPEDLINALNFFINKIKEVYIK